MLALTPPTTGRKTKIPLQASHSSEGCGIVLQASLGKFVVQSVLVHAVSFLCLAAAHKHPALQGIAMIVSPF